MFRFSKPFIDRLKARSARRRNSGAERRRSHRYNPLRETIRVGWWADDMFRTIDGLIQDISSTGIGIWVEELPDSAGPFELLLVEPPRPQPILEGPDEPRCPWLPSDVPDPAGKGPNPWVAADLMGSRPWRDPERKIDVGFVIHLRFPRGCPYDFFRGVTHGGGLDGAPPANSPEFETRYWR